MRAVWSTGFGGPEVLVGGHAPDPFGGPGQVVVDVAHAGDRTSRPGATELRTLVIGVPPAPDAHAAINARALSLSEVR